MPAKEVQGFGSYTMRFYMIITIAIRFFLLRFSDLQADSLLLSGRRNQSFFGPVRSYLTDYVDKNCHLFSKDAHKVHEVVFI